MKHASVIAHCLGGLALIAMLSACGARDGGLAPVDMKGAGAPRETSPKSGAVPESYQVQRGDTIYALARKFDVPVKALIDANQFQPPYTLIAGQKIQVPRQKIHTVEAGDTLYGVSRRYGVDVSALVRANNLQEPYAIRVGQKLTLPAPVIASDATASAPPPPLIAPSPMPASPAPVGEGTLSKESGASSRDFVPAAAMASPIASSPVVRPAPAVTTPPSATQKTPVMPVETGAELDHSSKLAAETAPPPQAPTSPVAQAPAALLERSARNETIRQPPQPPPRAGKAFAWPVRGRVIATFGSQGHGLHNDGINIQAAKGTPVRAAENGVVAYAGSEIKGFGSLLLIRHADGYITAYAHNEALLVKRGDVVRRGQVISRVGATGNVDSPQLHFEVRKGSQAIDPEQMLGNPSVS